MNKCKENRELSWLKFNDRVLMQAKDNKVPLGEKLSFISIFQSNLDEFLWLELDHYMIKCYSILVLKTIKLE